MDPLGLCEERIVDKKDIEIWFQRNRAAVRDDIINAVLALLEAFRDYLIPGSSIGDDAEGKIATYVLSKIKYGGDEAALIISIWQDDLRGGHLEDAKDFSRVQQRILERARTEADKWLEKIRDKLLDELEKNPGGIPCLDDVEVRSKEEHRSNILEKWWRENIEDIEIVFGPDGSPQGLNFGKSGYSTDDLKKIFRGINQPRFKYHLPDLSEFLESRGRREIPLEEHEGWIHGWEGDWLK
jgi:hypothetical protein